MPSTIFCQLIHIFQLKNVCNSFFNTYLGRCFNCPHVNGKISLLISPLFYCVANVLFSISEYLITSNGKSYSWHCCQTQCPFFLLFFLAISKYSINIQVWCKYISSVTNRVLTSLFKHSFPNIDTVSSLGLVGVCTTSSSPMSSEGSTVFLSWITFTTKQETSF